MIWEDAVIGSSPLMLLHARSLALAGRRVVVLAGDSGIGGAWCTEELNDGTRVETACHVIEAFPEVYEILEDATGTSFDPLDAQPVRLARSQKRSSRIFPYFNQAILLGTALRMAFVMMKNLPGHLLGNPAARNAYLNNRYKLGALLRFQRRYLIHCPPMRGPRGGYADFLNRLKQGALKAGVQFEASHIHSMEWGTQGTRGVHWVLNTLQGAKFEANRVHCSTSCDLKSLDARRTRWQAQTSQAEERRALVVELPKCDEVISQTYVGIWGDLDVRRISRIDRCALDGDKAIKLYLLELHDDIPAHNVIQIAQKALEAAGILRPNGNVNLRGCVTCPSVQSSDLLTPGPIGPNCIGIHSAGNLAAGIAIWYADNEKWMAHAKSLQERYAL